MFRQIADSNTDYNQMEALQLFSSIFLIKSIRLFSFTLISRFNQLSFFFSFTIFLASKTYSALPSALQLTKYIFDWFSLTSA